MLESELADHSRFVESRGREGHRLVVTCAIVEDFDFAGIELTEVLAVGAVIRRCSFDRANLAGIHFDHSRLEGVRTRGVVGESPKFWRCHLRRCSFEGARFYQPSFWGARIEDTTFGDSELAGAVFHESHLIRTTFEDCDLGEASFNRTRFEDSILLRSRTTGASWEEATGIAIP